MSLRPIALVLAALLVACGEDPASALLPEVPAQQRSQVSDAVLSNAEAPVPPQCYTRTEGQHNPCYVCHQVYDQAGGYRMNKLNDGYLQGAYRFSEVGETNRWRNLFVDKRDFIRQIDDAAIDAYIAQDNYSALAQRLQARDWAGFVPDLAGYALGADAFDELGFAQDGSHWVAFNYKPLPSTFWPSNGSTDDVLIRLPKAFRQQDGMERRDIYLANLALLEMAIKDLAQISLPPVDETRIGEDLNGDGQLATEVGRISRRESYLGDAAGVALMPQQYPAGTEFLHSVRYVGVSDDGGIEPSVRMKELRYMRKIRQLSDEELSSRYARERKEKFEQKLPHYVNHGDRGFENGLGWMIQGFIEDYAGELRPQSYEERMFCMGCHSAIGSTIDQVFSFARKRTGAAGWGYIDLHGMPDAPSVSGGEGEILEYFRRVGGGNEFRENDEIRQRWFADGQPDEVAIRQADVYALITPSPARARELNKAYTWIVRHQSFVHGRDANPAPAQNVHREVDVSEPPLRGEFRLDNWDMRLAWPD